MSEYQKWVAEFKVENEIDESELSSNTFGTMVWDHQQKEIDRLTEVLEKIKLTAYLRKQRAVFVIAGQALK